MRLLKEKDDEELKALVQEYEDEGDGMDEEENFAWYELRDKNTYFVLNTKNKVRYVEND